jgi:hypothetical protein
MSESVGAQAYVGGIELMVAEVVENAGRGVDLMERRRLVRM